MSLLYDAKEFNHTKGGISQNILTEVTKKYRLLNLDNVQLIDLV